MAASKNIWGAYQFWIPSSNWFTWLWTKLTNKIKTPSIFFWLLHFESVKYDLKISRCQEQSIQRNGTFLLGSWHLNKNGSFAKFYIDVFIVHRETCSQSRIKTWMTACRMDQTSSLDTLFWIRIPADRTSYPATVQALLGRRISSDTCQRLPY